jgi:hypothetical protein
LDLVHAPREGTKARDPRAQERAAVVILAGTAGLTGCAAWRSSRSLDRWLGERNG